MPLQSLPLENFKERNIFSYRTPTRFNLSKFCPIYSQITKETKKSCNQNISVKSSSWEHLYTKITTWLTESGGQVVAEFAELDFVEWEHQLTHSPSSITLHADIKRAAIVKDSKKDSAVVLSRRK